MTDTDVFALVSSVVWVVGLSLGYTIGHFGGPARTPVRQRVTVRFDRASVAAWRRARPLLDTRPGRVVAPRTVAPPRDAGARTSPRARLAPPR